MITVKVIPWTWRDGSVHLEVRCVTLVHDGDVARTHIDNIATRFETVCGEKYFARLSGVGLQRASSVNCETCKSVLRSMSFECTFASVGIVNNDNTEVQS